MTQPKQTKKNPSNTAHIDRPTTANPKGTTRIIRVPEVSRRSRIAKPSPTHRQKSRTRERIALGVVSAFAVVAVGWMFLTPARSTGQRPEEKAEGTLGYLQQRVLALESYIDGLSEILSQSADVDQPPPPADNELSFARSMTPVAEEATQKKHKRIRKQSSASSSKVADRRAKLRRAAKKSSTIEKDEVEIAPESATTSDIIDPAVLKDPDVEEVVFPLLESPMETHEATVEERVTARQREDSQRLHRLTEQANAKEFDLDSLLENAEVHPSKKINNPYTPARRLGPHADRTRGTKQLAANSAATPQTPAKKFVDSAIQSIAPAIKKCGDGVGGNINMVLAFSGKTGRVVHAQPAKSDVYAGTFVGQCAAKRASLAKVPKFKKRIMIIEHPFKI